MWYRFVSFGPWTGPRGIYRTEAEARRALQVWADKQEHTKWGGPGTDLAVRSVRLRAYVTRAEARRADVADQHGETIQAWM